MNHYPHHIGDFAKDTLGFNQGAIGAYRLIMDAYYANEEAPPAEDVYVIGRATTPVERKNVEKALTKFELRNGRYYHKRVEEELASYRARSEAATAAANARWDAERDAPKDAKKHAKPMRPHAKRIESAPLSAQPDAMPTSNHEPINPKPTNHQTLPEVETTPPHPPPVAVFSVKAPAERVAMLASIAIQGGVRNANSNNPHVQQWAADGVTDDTLRDAIAEVRRTGKPVPQAIAIAYLQPVVARIHEGSEAQVTKRFLEATEETHVAH